MKLSDAITLGAMLRPQTTKYYSRRERTCALGAALEAVGELGKKEALRATRVIKIWPWLAWPLQIRSYKRKPKAGEIGCNCGKKVAENMQDLVMHMNDFHKKSRTEIAAWVAEVECLITKQLRTRPTFNSGYRLEDMEAQLKRTKKLSPPKAVEVGEMKESRIEA